jgi:DNA-binding NarL/FixJ family response regulator
MTRIFLVDDHPLEREGIKALLAGQPDLLVVGAASHGQALLGQLTATLADVVVLAMAEPMPESLATTRLLVASLPQLRVLVLATAGPERYVSQLFEAGAHGYVLKNAHGEELLVAIRAVAAGRQFLCSEIGIGLLHRMLAKNPESGLATAEEPAPMQLTRRETEILHLLADGLTTSEMADKLFTSKRTVETHRQNILEKTQTKNTAALIRLAMAQGLLD